MWLRVENEIKHRSKAKGALMTKPPNMYAIFKNYGKAETFRCDSCRRVLKKAWSDEDAIQEKNALFPGTGEEGHMLLCDDCMEKIKEVGLA